MSMLSMQADELREAAVRFEGYQNGEISRMLREAADTIESLRDRLQEYQRNNPFVGLTRGKHHVKHELSDYYCGRCGYPVTDHDSYCRECGGAFHESAIQLSGDKSWLHGHQGVGGESRYTALFGTPERAARTIHHGGTLVCRECLIREECAKTPEDSDCMIMHYDALLEWLKGGAE